MLQSPSLSYSRTRGGRVPQYMLRSGLDVLWATCCCAEVWQSGSAGNAACCQPWRSFCHVARKESSTCLQAEPASRNETLGISAPSKRHGLLQLPAAGGYSINSFRYMSSASKRPKACRHQEVGMPVPQATLICEYRCHQQQSRRCTRAVVTRFGSVHDDNGHSFRHPGIRTERNRKQCLSGLSRWDRSSRTTSTPSPTPRKRQTYR
jgi:hypothetical protein